MYLHRMALGAIGALVLMTAGTAAALALERLPDKPFGAAVMDEAAEACVPAIGPAEPLLFVEVSADLTACEPALLAETGLCLERVHPAAGPIVLAGAELPRPSCPASPLPRASPD